MIWNSRRSGANDWFNLNRPAAQPSPFGAQPPRPTSNTRNTQNAQLGTGMRSTQPPPTTTTVAGGPYTTGQDQIGPGGLPLNAPPPVTDTRPVPPPNTSTWPGQENNTPVPPHTFTPGQLQPGASAPQQTQSYTDQYGYPADPATGQPLPMDGQQLVSFFLQKAQSGSPFSAVDALRVRQWMPGPQGDALANAVLRAAAGFPFEYQPPAPTPTPTPTPAAPPPVPMHRGQPMTQQPQPGPEAYASVWDRPAGGGVYVPPVVQQPAPQPQARPYRAYAPASRGGIFIR